MYEYFKNIAEKSSCNLSGACSIHPSVNSLYEILLSQAREMSFYLVKLKEFSISDTNAQNIIIDTLSIFLINTSFNPKKYLWLLSELYRMKNSIKEKYQNYCKENDLPCEIMNTNFELNKNTTITDLIKYAENSFKNRQKNCDKSKQRLFELITLFARLSAINLIKLKKYNYDYPDYSFEITRFFALTNGYSIRNEKIKRRIREFSKFAFEIGKTLMKTYAETYGKKEEANVLLNEKKGHSILVSGDDLDELEKLLNTIDKLNPKEKINVYTNGALFLAHFYPFFKKNKYLKGHWGSDSAEYDFSNFPGVILVTRNFIQKIDGLYRGEIFSKKLISFNKVFDIEGDNYEPLISAASKIEGFKKDGEEKKITINYTKTKIEKAVENLKEKEIVIIVGKNNDNNIVESYQNKKIININTYAECDILLDIMEQLEEKNVCATIFFAQCDLLSLYIVLSLLNKKINLNITNCPNTIINPHVIESLKADFKVDII